MEAEGHTSAEKGKSLPDPLSSSEPESDPSTSFSSPNDLSDSSSSNTSSIAYREDHLDSRLPPLAHLDSRLPPLAQGVPYQSERRSQMPGSASSCTSLRTSQHLPTRCVDCRCSKAASCSRHCGLVPCGNMLQKLKEFIRDREGKPCPPDSTSTGTKYRWCRAALTTG